MAFFGTPEFAVPTLRRLIEGRHEVVAVICQPDRRRGRGRHTSTAPVADVALETGLELLRPERIADAQCVAALAARRPDLGVVVAFGQFIPKKIRELPSLGYMINGHASLLPRHRGAAPIVRCLLAGDSETAVSAMRVEREMDAGPVALQHRIAIGPGENAGQLAARMSELTADVLEQTLEAIVEGRVVWTPQDASLATEAPKIGAADAMLDWRESAEALARRVRAMAPAPGAFTRLDNEKLRILQADFTSDPVDVAPGTLSVDSEGELRIATRNGWLVPRVLQRPGKRPLPVADFVRGRPIEDGATVG
ncbi:MAG: methionyl-tRNA formyltransferase [Myxococcota bacterium]